MEDKIAESQLVTKSISCTKLPEALLDKQTAKTFFGKFGVIKRFILRPKRNECTVEYETVEAAQQALGYQGSFQIFPTPTKQDSTEEFIDPDVRSELDLMYPAGARSQPKQAMESFIRNPQSLMKPRMPAVARLKAEPLSVSISSDPRLISAARNELETLSKRPARSAEEKLQILDARDKLFRLVNAKTTDIAKVTSTKGTCKDMCPEKERLMREARLQVASFELSDYDSSMDQKKAIKQYSRSAADAEAPLPHELRPETALKTTMTYLLHNIIDLSVNSQSIGDWFHFVWDRTRGIRKDITQQELCSPITVELVEQCVRFHIHCSARLIAEDPSIFDQKINTENLTKCLQTLKYMYNDLKVKNIKCPNEAEFRAYVVILNLNESGNFLWEIKQLEKIALNSKEVRFALDVYFSVANNNYVKFFNLARKASYMNACLLLRYFAQVRMKAINIIMRTYTPRNRGFEYSISVLANILGFDDNYSAVGYLTHHNLQCDIDRDIVYLDRQKFGIAETPYQMRCPQEIVEWKLETSVSEAICGGPLPSPDCFLKLVPHSSFDNDGFLRREAFYAEDQNGPSQIVKENVFKIPRGSPPVSPMLKVHRSDQPDGTANENVFYKSPVSSPFSSPKQAMTNVFKTSQQPEAKQLNPFASKTTFGTSQSQTQSIFGGSASPSFSFTKQPVAEINPAPEPVPSPFSFVKSVAKPADSIFGGQTAFGSSSSKELFSFTKPVEQTQPAFNQFSFSATAEAEDLAKKRKEQEVAEKARLEEERILKEKAVLEEKLRIEKERLEKLEQERREAQRLREEEKRRLEEIAEREKATQEACEQVLESLINEIVDERVESESQQSVLLYVKLPEDFYDAFEFDIVLEQVHNIYQQEFLAHVNETKMKYELLYNCFNQWRTTTRKEIRRREKLSNIGCSILNTSLEQQASSLHHPEQRASLSNMKQYLSGSPQTIKITDFNQFPTINLFDALLVKQFEVQTNIFWKLLVSIPFRNEENCLGFSSFINKWLIKTFGESTEENIFYIGEKTMKRSRKKLAICIRKLQGSELVDESGKFSSNTIEHSNGLIFFTTSTDLPASRKRLQNLLDKIEFPVPVSIIVYKNQVKSSDEEELGRYFDLSFELNVSSFEINLFYECHDKDKTLTQVVIDCCQFLNDLHIDELLGKNSRLFDLQMQHLLDFFQLTIGDEMWRRIELSCRQSEMFRKSMTSFNNAIQLYNKCIDKLMSMLTNDFSKLPSFPVEFRKQLMSIDSRIPNSYEYFPENWKEKSVQSNQIEFVHDLKLAKMPNDSFTSFDDFKQKLMSFLSSNMTEHKDKVFQAVTAKIIDHLYHQKLTSDEDVLEAIQNFCWLTILAEIVVGKFNKVFHRSHHLSTSIIYLKKDLHLYRTVPWWYSINFDNVDRAEEPQKKKAKIEQATSEEIGSLLIKAMGSLNKLKNKIENFKEVSNNTREVSKDFDRHLYDFEENLSSRMQELGEKFKE